MCVCVCVCQRCGLSQENWCWLVSLLWFTLQRSWTLFRLPIQICILTFHIFAQQKEINTWNATFANQIQTTRGGGFQRGSVTWRNCLDSDGLAVAVLSSLNTKRFLWLAYFKRQVCPRFTTEQLLMWSCIRRKCSVCISSRWTQRSTDSELLLL